MCRHNHTRSSTIYETIQCMNYTHINIKYNFCAPQQDPSRAKWGVHTARNTTNTTFYEHLPNCAQNNPLKQPRSHPILVAGEYLHWAALFVLSPSLPLSLFSINVYNNKCVFIVYIFFLIHTIKYSLFLLYTAACEGPCDMQSTRVRVPMMRSSIVHNTPVISVNWWFGLLVQNPNQATNHPWIGWYEFPDIAMHGNLVLTNRKGHVNLIFLVFL